MVKKASTTQEIETTYITIKYKYFRYGKKAVRRKLPELQFLCSEKHELTSFPRPLMHAQVLGTPTFALPARGGTNSRKIAF
jgi:hypothetical protein